MRSVVLIFMFMSSFFLFAKDTELKFYRPFLHETPVEIIKKMAGECWQQSERIKREDAWRCQAEEKVYDPCFINLQNPKEALCPESPWSKHAALIHLTKTADNSLHSALDMAETLPWAVELTTGEKCQAIDKGEVYDGLEIRYHCNNQTQLFGRVQRCKSEWSILQRTASGVTTGLMSKAWF
ncbi:MAG: hypothetical protein H0U57_11750 [Tatlockia sp.]|nr:hypothetical protein [Tatlockia sp.]